MPKKHYTPTTHFLTFTAVDTMLAQHFEKQVLHKKSLWFLEQMTEKKSTTHVLIARQLLIAQREHSSIWQCRYPFFPSQKSVKSGFSANSLSQTFALLYAGAGLEGASSYSGRRTFLTNLANKCTAIHILKTLAGHRSISTTAAYLYSSPSQLKAAVELV